MLLSAVSVLVVAQSISEIPEELMNNSVYFLLIIEHNGDVSPENYSFTFFLHSNII